MQPLTVCGQATLSEAPVVEPHFWRVTYADLVTMWGEEGALRMLRAMERAYEQQTPAPPVVRTAPCSEPEQAVA
jgi:hypothetical protein